MKKLLLLGAALLGVFGAAGTSTLRAGDDGPAYSYERPAPRYYEGRPVERHYCPPPPPPVYYAPVPTVVVVPRFYHHHRRYYRPYGYGYPYAYGYAPGVHVGIGF